ncbi:MAG: hypothetical protein K1000chlam3_00845 [Chlamydiae bacterium]|nr:hypothetical protein [Chlamydiota bacterium]
MKTFFSKFSHLSKRFLVGDFKQLLIFLILLFIFRPYDIGVNYITIWHLFFTGVLLAAIFNCHHTPTVKVLALVLGIPTFILNWWSLFELSEWLFIAGLASSLVFLVFSIFSLLSRVLLGKVTADILRGTICVYFMIGFAFAIVYTLMQLTHPGSFNGLAEKAALFPHGHYHAEMVYFSFITLLAIGYGDITPAGDVGQMFAVSEGLVGQFYLAILVARMVSVYARRAQAQSQPKSK